MSAPEYVLDARQISKTYQDGALRAEVLKQVDLRVAKGQTIAIMGSSGAGKSTLLHILGGLDLPSSGDVIVAGENIANLSDKRRGLLRNRSLGFIYQFHHLLPEFTALENVCMPLMIAGVETRVAGDRATQLLERVGLGHRLQHKPGELSGGERQRAAVARALINAPAAILADEPTGNLDAGNARQVFDLLLELNREMGMSLVLVTHDMQLAKRMQSIFALRDGKLHASPMA